MAVPKRRTSHSKTRMGRAHHAIKPPAMALCDHCQQVRLPHRVCAHCGWYKGRQVVAVKD